MPPSTRRKVIAGSGSGRAAISGILAMNTAAVGNVGSGEDTLYTATIPARTFYKNGQALRITLWGLHGADGNAKTLKVKLGGTTVLDSGALTTNAKNWKAEVIIQRLSATAQRYVSSMLNDTTPLTTQVSAALALDEDTALTLLVTGETTDTDMLILYGIIVELLPTPN